MMLLVRLDVRGARLWHLQLLERLARRDVALAVVQASSERVPARFRRLLALEAALTDDPVSTLFSRIDPGRLTPFLAKTDAPPDRELDLRGDAPVGRGKTWSLLFDGVAGEAALAEALLSGRRPMVTIRDGDDVVAEGRVGTDGHGSLALCLQDALARVVSLIEGAVLGGRPRLPASDLPTEATAALPPARSLARIAATTMARRAARTAYRLIYRSPHWRVGWRRLIGPDLIDAPRHPEAGWTTLPDDGLRFYADPFPIEHEGTTTLFVEEYPHATRKGIISAVAFDATGPLGRPEPVLECPYHLSYPFVFARDGEVWMIPESGQAGTIDLYRARRFPGGWVKERTLVSDVTASDATLLEREGRWWMFATVRDGGSHSDMLCLWSAPDFHGPWVPHPHNPVLIDCASARPAGRLVARGDRLFRPVQDCRTTYGGALGIAEVLRLDEAGFTQRITGHLASGPGWAGRHLHTLNGAGGFEFIDGTGRARRRWRDTQAGAAE